MKTRNFLLIFVLAILSLTGCNQNHEHVHSYDLDNPIWNWESVVDVEGYTATATLTCSDCEEVDDGHVLTLDATISQVAVDPTCENDGSITYTASITYEGKTITDSKTDIVPKLGHYFETITVEGDYKKNYFPFESFDLSNIVVKGICSRGGCGKIETLSQDEYFVIYQTQNADHLCTGDTKVTISSSYAPFATYELTGLTVDYLENSISGMEANYVTTCHHAPDLSGVTALSDELEIKYYLDSACTQETTLNDIVAGTYYIKATASGKNYKTITQTATLTVNHVFDQCIVENEYLHNAATKFETAKYFKSCVCGAASASENDLFEGEKLSFVVATSAFDNHEEVTDDIEVPDGYQTISKSPVTFDEDKQNTSFISDFSNSGALGKLYFMIFTKGEARLCQAGQQGWSGELVLAAETWYLVEIIQNDDSTYSSVIKDENGDVIIQYSNVAFSQVLPYYQFGKGATCEIYSTEVYGVRVDNETFNQLVADSTVSSYTVTDIISPQGYQTVTKSTKNFGDKDQYKPFLKNVAVDGYQSLSFAFFTKGCRFTNEEWTFAHRLNTWYLAMFTVNEDGTVNCDLCLMDGTVKYSYKNKSSFAEAMPYYNWGDNEPLEWYSTEVRGIAK